MKITEYIRDQWIAIWISALTFFFTGLFLFIMGTQLPVIVTVESLFFLGFFLCEVWDCFRKKGYYDQVERVLAQLEEKNYLSELLTVPSFYDGKLLYGILKKDEKYLNDIIARQQQEMIDYKDYIQTWSHEIKTPIAVERLIMENHKSPVMSSLEEEVGKIEAYVEQMLYYSKSGSLEADYLVQPVNVKRLIMDAISKNRKMMIESSVFPKFGNLDYEILTDPKWMEFIFGQLITNSVKYRDLGEKSWISFDAREEDGRMLAITISDNGIGIPSQDVPRVFRKGFTGENGRTHQKSTGMGLYLCKNLCDKMDIRLELDSEWGKGTSFTFHMKRSR